MAKKSKNEALASLARLLRETDALGEAPATAVEIRRARRFLAGLGLEAEEFVAAFEGREGEGTQHLPIVEGMLDRLAESAKSDRGAGALYADAPEEPDLDRRVREIVRSEVDRLKKTGGQANKPSGGRGTKPSGA